MTTYSLFLHFQDITYLVKDSFLDMQSCSMYGELLLDSNLFPDDTILLECVGDLWA